MQFPFILEGKIDKHARTSTVKYPGEIAKKNDNLYVDVLITGGESFR